MLVEFRVENFRSFKEEQKLSMVASGSDKMLEENCSEAGKLKLLRGAAVYGPNAAGKSNLVRAIRAMKDWIVTSASQETKGQRELAPFLLDESASQRPTSFEATIVLKGVRHQYGFSVLRNQVMGEWLIAFPKGHPQVWFERTYSKKRNKPIFKLGGYLKGERAKLVGRTRDDSLLLSVAAQWNHRQLLSIYNWFSTHLRVITAGGVKLSITADALIDEEEAVQPFVLRFLRDADINIHNMKALKHDPEELASSLPQSTREEERTAIINFLRANPQYTVMMVHQNSSAGHLVPLDLNDESDGTQQLFRLAVPWLVALTTGYTIVYDEIERSLHSMLVRELVKPFFCSEQNKLGSQLILATHDTTLLDPDLYRRDQIWFAEKNEEGATQLIPLSDYKPRSGEALQKGYLSGRYGATPILKAFSIHDTEGKIASKAKAQETN